MNKNRPITTKQAMAVIISTILGIGILSYPRYMAEAGDSGAPLVSAAGIPIAFAGCYFTASICRRFPHQNLFVFSRSLLGTVFADTFTALIFLFFAFSTGITMRQFGEVCVTVVFKKTPVEAVILLMLLVVALSVRRNIVKFTYIHAFYLPVILLSVMWIILIAMKDVGVLNLLPITGNHTTLASFSKGMISSATHYQGTFVLVLLVPLMRKPEQVLKAGSLALMFTGIVYLLIVTVTVGLFGAHESQLLFHPTLEMARSISVGTGLLERLDAIFIVMWVVSIFTTVFTNYYLAVHALKEVTRFKDHRLLASFLLPFICGSSLLPRNIYQAYDIASVTAKIGLCLLTFYSFFLWLVALIRKKGDLNYE